jgi:hypothetical protein
MGRNRLTKFVQRKERPAEHGAERSTPRHGRHGEIRRGLTSVRKKYNNYIHPVLEISGRRSFRPKQSAELGAERSDSKHGYRSKVRRSFTIVRKKSNRYRDSLREIRRRQSFWKPVAKTSTNTNNADDRPLLPVDGELDDVVKGEGSDPKHGYDSKALGSSATVQSASSHCKKSLRAIRAHRPFRKPRVSTKPESKNDQIYVVTGKTLDAILQAQNRHTSSSESIPLPEVHPALRQLRSPGPTRSSTALEHRDISDPASIPISEGSRKQHDSVQPSPIQFVKSGHRQSSLPSMPVRSVTQGYRKLHTSPDLRSEERTPTFSTASSASTPATPKLQTLRKPNSSPSLASDSRTPRFSAVLVSRFPAPPTSAPRSPLRNVSSPQPATPSAYTLSSSVYKSASKSTSTPNLRSNTCARDLRIATSNLASAVAQLSTEDVGGQVSRASTPEYLTARKYEGEAANEKLERDRQAGVEADGSKGKG